MAIIMILTACSRPPAEDMNKAIDAVTMAENDADAVSYAGNTLIRARDALVRMQSEADAKRYDAAKNFAAEAVSLAEKAIADGKTGAARAREEAANLISGLAGPLSETANALDVAEQNGIPVQDLDALKDDMDSARRSYSDAQQSLANNNYPDSIAKSQNVRSLLSHVNGRLTEAAQAVSRKQ